MIDIMQKTHTSFTNIDFICFDLLFIIFAVPLSYCGHLCSTLAQYYIFVFCCDLPLRRDILKVNK